MQRKLSKNDCLPPKISCPNIVNTVIAKIDNEFFCRGVWQYAPTNFFFFLSLKAQKIKGIGGALRTLLPLRALREKREVVVKNED